MAVKPIPDGYHSVTPHLTVMGAEALLDFVTKAFDAEEVVRIAMATARSDTPRSRTATR